MKNKVRKERVKKADFEKKILNRLYIESDRSFMRRSYVLDDLYYVMKEGISEADIKRLKRLRSAALKNGKNIRAGRIIAVSAIAAVIIMFNVFFKDMLIERGAEKGLENIFKAKADITGLRLSLLKGRVSMDSLTIGDSEEEFRNIIETGYTAGDIRVSQLLKKKFVLEELSVTDIAFGTQRETSGFLSKKKMEKDEDKRGDSAAESPVLDDVVKERMPDFSSPAVAEQYNTTVSELNNKWKKRISDMENSKKELKKAYEQVSSTDISSIDDPAKTAKLISQASDLHKKIKETLASIKETKSDFDQDSRKILYMKNSLRESLDRDIKTVLAMTGKGAPSNLIGGIAENFLGKKLGKQIPRLLSLIKRPEKNVKKNHEPAPEFKGRLIHFPGSGYPHFLMENILISYNDEDNHIKKTGSAANISSSPLTWGRTVTLEYTEERKNSLMDLSASFLPSDRSLKGRITLKNQTGTADLSSPGLADGVSFSYDLDGIFGGTSEAPYFQGHISLFNIRVSVSDKTAVSSALERFLRDSGKLKASISWGRPVAGALSIKADADLNLNSLLGQFFTDSSREETETIRGFIQGETGIGELLGDNPDFLSSADIISGSSQDMTSMGTDLDDMIKNLKKKGLQSIFSL